MSVVTDVLRECQAAGVDLYLDNGRLRYRSPPGAYTDDLKEKVASYRDELIAKLQKPLSPGKRTEIESAPTRPQFRITLADGRISLQSHRAGVTLEQVKAFNAREWGVPVVSVEAVPWDSDKRGYGDFEAAAAGRCCHESGI